MQRSLYIHIGAPKTGSSALQEFFDANRERLKATFALYPKATVRGYGHHDIALLLPGAYPQWATPQNKPLEALWSEIENECTAHDGDILLSSENYYLFPEPDRLAKMIANSKVFGNLAVRIIVYLRPQEESVVAWYNQIVKAQGATNTFEESFQEFRYLWDYDKQLSTWATCFGRKNIAARIYRGGSGQPWDIRKDFIEAFGLSATGFNFTEKRINSNLNRDLLEFQRIINRLPLSIMEKRGFHKQLIELTTCTRGMGIYNENPILSDKEKQMIRASYELSNAKVASEYLGQGKLFDEVETTGAEFRNYQGLDVETMVSILGWIILKNRAEQNQ
jgi:hypothetical protein